VVRRPQSPCPGVSLSPPCSPYPSPPSSPSPSFETGVPTLAYSGDIPLTDAQQPSLSNGPIGEYKSKKFCVLAFCSFSKCSLFQLASNRFNQFSFCRSGGH
jgi:hypothetical protein